MPFCEKLSFLMDVTKTSNSALAHAVKLDASYISRLRGGKRLCPRDDGCIYAMASYFARHCEADYQRRAIGDALGTHALPQDTAALSPLLARWLSAEKSGEAGAIGQFLGGLSGLRPALTIPASTVVSSEVKQTPLEVFYGVEGKRRAVLTFLSEVAERKSPQTLLLFSDEETGWMADDPMFARQWAALMFRVLKEGNSIRIIHTIQRDLDEMLRAIGQWMPLYMTGNIEPYFYPKKRDGIFKRTLFIAPETAAVVSSSVGESVFEAANLLFRDATAVSAYTAEFTQYLRLCRPLMRIFTSRDGNACVDALLEFEQQTADTLVCTESLSLLTMPEDLLRRILLRADFKNREAILLLHTKRRGLFLELLQTCRFYELIRLPSSEELSAGTVKLALSEMLRGGALCYTAEEYKEHLAAILELMKSFPNYRAYTGNFREQGGYAVYVRDSSGVFIFKTSEPPVVLFMNDGNMVAAFWDYLQGKIGEKAYESPDFAASVKTVQAYMESLV